MLKKDIKAECLEDHELMRVVRDNKDTDEDKAMAAFGTIYYKYCKILWSLCVRVCGEGSVADLVFEETWRRIKMHPDYDYHTYGTRFETWMSRIARRAFYSIRNHLTLGYDELEDEDLAIEPHEFELDGCDEESVSLNMQLVEDAMAQLSEKESDILRTYIEYDTGKKRHVPDRVLTELASRYHTTKVNLRQIKKRALKKVLDYINSRK